MREVKTTAAKIVQKRILLSMAWFKVKIQRDFYELLEGKKLLTEDNIRKAYWKVSKRYHPDLHPNDAHAKRKMQIVNGTRDLLLKSKSLDKIRTASDNIFMFIPKELVERLRRVIDEDPNAREKLYIFDRKRNVRRIIVSIGEIAELVSADSELIPWGIEKLNMQLVEEGLNPFMLEAKYLLDDFNHHEACATSLLRPAMRFNKLGLIFTLAEAVRKVGPEKALREFNLAYKKKKKPMVYIFRKGGKDIYVLSRYERFGFKIQDGNGAISIVAKEDIDKIFSSGRLAKYSGYRFRPLSSEAAREKYTKRRSRNIIPKTIPSKIRASN